MYIYRQIQSKVSYYKISSDDPLQSLSFCIMSVRKATNHIAFILLLHYTVHTKSLIVETAWHEFVLQLPLLMMRCTVGGSVTEIAEGTAGHFP